MTASKTGDVYAREVVMARVGHLIRRKQHEIERITRILRSFFDPEQVLAPEPGQVTRIILIGPYARRSWFEDERTISFSDYEFWVIVNHPAFKEECCWSRARDIIQRERRPLRGRSRSLLEGRHPHRQGRTRHLHPRPH
jgi:hypothetical protein